MIWTLKVASVLLVVFKDVHLVIFKLLSLSSTLRYIISEIHDDLLEHEHRKE